MRVSVIIPNWNGKKLLQVSLDSLKKVTFKDFETIVVDNGSEDGSLEYIKKFHANVRAIPLDKNYGFAKAVNEGIKKSSGKYCMLLNNDTEVDTNFLSYLVKAGDKHPEVGFIAPRVLDFYRRNIIDSAGDAIDVVGHSYNIGLGEEDGSRFKKEGYVFMVTAGAGLFKREVFDSVGLFDEDYFTYMEDIDICLRGQLMGYKGWYEPRAVVYHIHKATSDRIKHLTEYWQFRNMTQNIIKDYPRGLLLEDLNWLKIILVNINTIRFLVSKGFFWQGIAADFYILVNIIKLLKKRARIQSKKEVTDQYFIQNFRKKKLTFFGLLKKGI